MSVRAAAYEELIRRWSADWATAARFDPNTYVQRAGIDGLAARAARSPEDALAGLRAYVNDPRIQGLTLGRAAHALLNQHRAEDMLLVRARLDASTRARDAEGLLLALVATEPEPASVERLCDILSTAELPMELDFYRDLSLLPQPAVGDALATALTRAQPEVRLTVAATLLGWQPARAEAVLLPALRGKQMEDALEVLDGLEASPAPAALRLLQGASRSADRLVRLRARLILMSRGEIRATALTRLLSDEEREIRIAAVRAAGQLRAARSPAALTNAVSEHLRAAASGADPTLQIAALRALGVQPDAADRAALTAALDDESMVTRVAAAVALSRAESP